MPRQADGKHHTLPYVGVGLRSEQKVAGGLSLWVEGIQDAHFFEYETAHRVHHKHYRNLVQLAQAGHEEGVAHIADTKVSCSFIFTIFHFKQQ